MSISLGPSARAALITLLILGAFEASCGDIASDLITRDPSIAFECLRDADCPPERRCDTSTNRCADCLDPADCASGQTCNLPSHTCILLCTAGATCTGASPFCDQATGACRGCRGDDECDEAAPHCDMASGRCLQCLSLDDCEDDDDALLCSPTGRCVECLTDGHCEEAQERCSTVLGECGVPCTGSVTCPADDPVCDLAVGFCVECTSDEHCGDGNACRNFDCVERDENDQENQSGQND